MSSETQTETVALAAIENSHKVHAGSFSEVPFVLVPEGYVLKDLEDLQPRPRRIEQIAKLTTIEAFIAYVKDHKLPTSVIFADEQARTLRAVIDYHQTSAAPSWCSHQATYEAKYSREALAWFGQDQKPMQQIAFAEFLEEHVADVVSPAGAVLLEQALKLQFIQKAVFGSAVRLQSGEFQLNWSEENEKGTVELPEKIGLGIPIFHNGTTWAIEARLRYRLGEGKVTFTYKIIEKERTVEHAFGKVVQDVRAELNLPIYFGSR